MKKTLLSIAVAIASLSASAQNSDSERPLKPAAGSVVTELNFNPFKGNLSLNNALNQVKLRYFATNDMAIRLGVHYSSVDTAVNVGNPYGTNSNFAKDERKSSSFALNLGFEKHFRGTNRLSPYVGADLSFGSMSASQDIRENETTVEIENAWAELVNVGQPYYNYQYLPIKNAFSRFGITAVAGFDFYMARNFFLGYEFSLGYMKTKYKLPEIRVYGNNQNEQPVIEGKMESSSFSTQLMNGIRIGYAF